MRQFIYTIKDPIGLHARPAGLLVKAAKALDSNVIIEKEDGKATSASKLMAVMSLGVKQGDTVKITLEGGNEAENAAAMEQFFKDNL